MVDVFGCKNDMRVGTAASQHSDAIKNELNGLKIEESFSFSGF